AEARHAEAAALVDALPDAELARRLDALAYLAGNELYLHRLDEAQAHAERLIDVGRATGQGRLFPVAWSILGMTWYFHGRLAEAADPLDGAVEAARLSGNAQSLAWNLYMRSRIALAAGDLSLALSTAQEAVDLTDAGEPTHHFCHAALALAEASLELGKPERAAELLVRSTGGDELPRVAVAYRAYFLETLVRARLALGQREAAVDAARAATESAAGAGLPLLRAWAERAEAAVALDAGDAARAAELALSATALADAAPLEAALCRRLAGNARAAAGDRDGGVALLEQAAATFEGHGALRFRDAAERDLRRLGQRIHRRSGPEGFGALTAREREIAERIVDRQTNREIAEALYLSPRTVETHVRNIFAKLGADSRVEVARIVEQSLRAV
ncbi:MAG TPA: LuxR C-terminal-related transcriptional regulator, partial [Solirubrobacter sp.]|nr:LuxR C-terminal-related transcriptional regulator [Solirubrobacter sp.]